MAQSLCYCGITLVEVDAETCPMSEETCLIERPTPYVSVLKATEIRSISMSHVSSVSSLSFSHSHDCHVRCTVSHSKFNSNVFSFMSNF